MTEITRWVTVGICAAAAGGLGWAAWRLWQLPPGPGNGDRVRWTLIAALALAWAICAGTLTAGAWLPRDLAREINRAALVAALATPSLLALRLVAHRLRRKP
jgi:hypothetical protein